MISMGLDSDTFGSLFLPIRLTATPKERGTTWPNIEVKESLAGFAKGTREEIPQKSTTSARWNELVLILTHLGGQAY